jgi:L-ascorbate metabolism protein UlaG (beta-lactamase superfamily)
MIASEHGRVMLGRVPYPGQVAPDLQPPLKTRAYRHGAVFAVKLEMGGHTLLHLGSAYLPPGLAEHRCDILAVSVAGWKRIPDFVPRLLEALRPQVVIPIHWDDFSVPLRAGRAPPTRIPFVDLKGFTEVLSRLASQVRVCQLGILETVVL